MFLGDTIKHENDKRDALPVETARFGTSFRHLLQL
jgi:hypothetical protein